MYCIYCGTEIKTDSKYCPTCGKSLQMVPDYSIYDEDDINLILESTKDIETYNNTSEDIIVSNNKNVKQKQKMNSKSIVTLIVILCVILLGVGLSVKFFVDNKNNNSYEYQMKLGDEALFKEKYEVAEGYYKHALTLSPNDLKARLKLADVYVFLDNQQEAISLLNEVISIDSNENYDAYKKLFDIYEEEGNIAAILDLRNKVTSDKVLKIFKDYVVDVPVANLQGGTYSEIISLKLVSDNNLQIFYTIDGKDPIEYGTLYQNKIEISDAGMHTVKFVAMNSLGVYSEIVTETYILEYEAPLDPEVTPNGGSFDIPTYVYITVPDGCSAYFTWDRTDPTVNSEKYVSPLLIPEGYNILSVIIIDDATGLSSGIYRGVFEYTTE
mgnify:FL=1